MTLASEFQQCSSLQKDLRQKKSYLVILRKSFVTYSGTLSEFPYETIKDDLMTISMAGINHFGKRSKTAILLPKKPLTQLMRAPNHVVVLMSER